MNGIFGTDSGIVTIVLLILTIVLLVRSVNSSMRLSRLERKYKMFMKGSDAQSLEKAFVRKFTQIDHLFEAKDEHEKAIQTIWERLILASASMAWKNMTLLMMWAEN
jgi:hypothetical protein